MMRRWTITPFQKNFSFKSQSMNSKSILNREISTHLFFFKQKEIPQPRFPLISQKSFSPTISFFCTEKEEKTKSYENKPLEEWSVDEVQDWFRNSNEFSEFAQKFKGMSGESLTLLKESAFIRRCPEMGDAIYARLQKLKGPPNIEAIFEEIHQKHPEFQFKTPPKSVNNIVKTFFPLKDRENEIKQITREVIKNFLSVCSKSDHKKDWHLFSVVGGSGTGKTRFSISALELVKEELFSNQEEYITFIEMNLPKGLNTSPKKMYESLLESLDEKRAFPIYFDFSNGDNFNEWKQVDKIQSAFLFSLASKTFFSKVKADAVRTEIPELSIFNDVSRVAKAIRKYHGIKSGEILTILFNFDEFQMMITSEDIQIAINPPSPVDKDKILIRQIALKVMSICQQLALFNIHLIPIFSGTLSLDYIRIFPATLYSLLSITLGPIQTRSSIEIIEGTLKNMKVPDSLIATMGNIPRALEYLVDVCKNQPSDTSSKLLFQETVKLIQDKYRLSSYHSNLIKSLLQLSLIGKKVNRFTKVDEVLIGNLEREGTIFLKPKEDGNYQIVFPLVFAAAYNKQIEIFNPQFVTYRPTITSSDFEKFVRDFEIFKNNLFVDLGIKETTFQERFYGALMSENLQSKKIQLSKMQSFDSKEEKLPDDLTKLITTEGDKNSPTTVNLAKQSTSIWIGRKCTSCDNIFSFPNQLNGKTLINLQEVKSTIIFQEATSAGVIPKEIEEERENAILGIRKILGSSDNNKDERRFPEHPQYEFLFTFLSNTHLSTTYNDLKKRILHYDDTMIVTKEQFEDYFSSIFSYIAYGDHSNSNSDLSEDK